MTVYVDDVRHAFGRMVMCHMWADTLDELLAMADTIGVARKWIQGHPELSFGKHRDASWIHFDIALAPKAKAIRAGAWLMDRYEPMVFTCWQEGRWDRIVEIYELRARFGHALDGRVR